MVVLYDFIRLLYWETKGLILLQYVFNCVKYLLESMLGANSFFMYVQVWTKFNLENFISPIEGNINYVTI